MIWAWTWDPARDGKSKYLEERTETKKTHENWVLSSWFSLHEAIQFLGAYYQFYCFCGCCWILNATIEDIKCMFVSLDTFHTFCIFYINICSIRTCTHIPFLVHWNYLDRIIYFSFWFSYHLFNNNSRTLFLLN